MTERIDEVEAFAEIVRRLDLYFDGLYHGDTKRLGQVFHPEARYVCATGGEFVCLGLADYFSIVDARPSPASRNEPRRDAIASIELAGPDTAFVRAHCAIGSKYYTDLLTLVRTGGEWRIISKVFHYEIEGRKA